MAQVTILVIDNNTRQVVLPINRQFATGTDQALDAVEARGGK